MGKFQYGPKMKTYIVSLYSMTELSSLPFMLERKGPLLFSLYNTSVV